MAKKKELNKTSQKKISICLQQFDIDTNEQFAEEFTNQILNDVRRIKDCSEKAIVDTYISTFEKIYNTINDINESEKIEQFIKKIRERTRQKLAAEYAPSLLFGNNIDTYFNEVKREYILHPMGESEELDFVPENKDIFIKNNLKLVIDCAKRYRNMGLPFDDLIQIGNLGLLKAWDKFDTSRANLQNDIIADIKNGEDDEFDREYAEQVIRRNFKYTKTLEATLTKLPEEGFANKQEFIDWVKSNVKRASFSSIGFAWIRAMILLELNSYGKIIRVPKSNKEEYAFNLIHLDAINPHTDDCYHDNQISEIAQEEFAVEDENIENMERKSTFKGMVTQLLQKLSGQDRRIIKKRFGIDTPYELSVSEIAEGEGLSTAKVKSSLMNSMKILGENISDDDKEMLMEMLT